MDAWASCDEVVSAGWETGVERASFGEGKRCGLCLSQAGARGHCLLPMSGIQFGRV